MRRLVLLPLLVLATPTLAAQQCALPAGGFSTEAQQPSAKAVLAPIPANHAHAPAADQSASAMPSTSSGPSNAIPPGLAGIPFVQHLATASAGNAITDLGLLHGLHALAVRSGDQIMFFQVSPDGLAAVSNLAYPLTTKQLLTVAQGNVTPLGDLHGFQGFHVRSGPQFQVFYATPDSEAVIPGVMWDSTGTNLTRPQIASIPGSVPTAVVGTDNRPEGPPPPALAAFQGANAGTAGSPDAPHLWMLVDPQCSVSVRAFQMLQPAVAAGRLQVSVIPISILDYEDQGLSTKSALALLSKPSEQIIPAWASGDVNQPPAPEAEARLRANEAIANAVGATGTPTFAWRKADGSEGRLDGLPGYGTPSDVEALVASIGR